MPNQDQPTRYVAIVPSLGSAYYLPEVERLVQVPMDEGYVHVAGPEVRDPEDGSGEVDWERGFESDAEAEAVRQIARTLSCLPEDATAPGGDPVLVSRADLSDLFAAIGSARMRAADACYADSDRLKGVDLGAAEDNEFFGDEMKRSGEEFLRAAGAISTAPNPLRDLTDLMPKVRWRNVDGPQP